MDAAIEKQFATTFRRIDEQRRDHDQLRNEYTEIRTVLVGINGKNGVKGHVERIDSQFADFRTEYRIQRDQDQKDRRASTRWTIGTVIAVGGLIVAAVGLLL
jgi:hypothetical protein